MRLFVPKDADDVGANPRCPAQQQPARFAAHSNPITHIKQCADMKAKLKAQMDGQSFIKRRYGKEYRPPTQPEIDAAEISEEALGVIADQIPFGLPDESLPGQ